MNNLLGQSWCGTAMCGVVRRCSVWFGLARQGKASTVAELGSLGRGLARLGAEGQGKASTVVRRGIALCGSLRRGMVGQGMVQGD